jgi:hypothetical protein
MGDSKEKGGKSTDELVAKWWEMTKDLSPSVRKQATDVLIKLLRARRLNRMRQSSAVNATPNRQMRTQTRNRHENDAPGSRTINDQGTGKVIDSS